MAYYRLEPFGEERSDLRAGIIASTIAEIYRDPKKRIRSFRPDDFMPAFDQPIRRKASPQELLKKVELINRALRGRDLRSKQ